MSYHYCLFQYIIKRAEINFQSINLFFPAKKIPEIHKFAVYFLFILFYFILHVRQVVLWINNCGSRDLGCFCSTFPPTSDFLCPLQALSPFLFLSSLCSRGAIVSQHHTLRFKTKQNQQTTIHLFSRLLLRCPTMSQHNLGQIQPFEANPHPSLSLDKYDCDFELTAI